MVQMFVEGQEIELSKDVETAITYQIDDITDLFGSRNTNRSKSIVIEGTANNNKVLGGIFEIASESFYDAAKPNIGYNFNPAIGASCILLQDGIQFFKGTLRVLETNELNGHNDYEVSVVGELGGLVSALGAKKLEELDFSDYDENWTETNIANSWDNIGVGTGLNYCLADYGNVTLDYKDFSFKAFRPALCVAEYIDKILTNAGYTYDFPLASTTRFKSLGILPNQKAIYGISSYLMTAERHVSPFTVSGAITNVDLSFETDVLGTFTANVGKTEFTYTGADLTNKAKLSIAGTTNGTVGISILKNGTSIGQIYLIGEASFFKELEVSTNLTSGDILKVEIANLGATLTSITFATLVVTTDPPVQVELNYNENIKVNRTIPKNILQKDFISSIVKLFNLYIYEDKDKEKHLIIKPYVDFYSADATNAVDWSGKISRDKVIRTKPMSLLTARYYDFKFANDGSDYLAKSYKDRWNIGYGDYKYDSAYQFSEDNKSLDIIFAPTILTGYSGVDKVFPGIYGNGTDRIIDFTIRIVQMKKVTSVTSWNMTSTVGGATLASYTNYGYCGNYNDPDAPSNDIHFGIPKELYFTLATGAVNVTQFNVYWSSYLAEISNKDSKLVTCYIRLNPSDIYDLDMSKYVYINGMLYRINRIIDYDPNNNELTQVELLKVINTSYS